MRGLPFRGKSQTDESRAISQQIADSCEGNLRAFFIWSEDAETTESISIGQKTGPENTMAMCVQEDCASQSRLQTI